jgi:hypothetical protein
MVTTDYRLDLSKFPPALHRIVKAWYIWQEVYLRKLGKHPGQDQRPPKSWETAEQVFWGARPPKMASERDLVITDGSGETYYLSPQDDVYYIDEEERSSRGRFWMFRRLEDAEKGLLFLMSQAARPGKYSDSPRYRWNEQGLNANVHLHKTDPEKRPGRVAMTVDREPIDRGWMGENDAIPFSHAITLTYDELDSAVREGIPPEWFTVNVVSASASI